MSENARRKRAGNLKSFWRTGRNLGASHHVTVPLSNRKHLPKIASTLCPRLLLFCSFRCKLTCHIQKLMFYTLIIAHAYSALPRWLFLK